MRYFTSDLHFGHKPIIEYCRRPYFTLEDMEWMLLHNINNVVTKDDILYILGDFSFYRKEQNAAIVSSIKCPCVLIRGNHDYSSRIKNVGFAEVYDELDIHIGKHLVTLSHYPFRGDHTATERYLDRRPKDFGQWLLHGHTHSRERINKEQRMLHVGVDAWTYSPISEEVVIQSIEG